MKIGIDIDGVLIDTTKFMLDYGIKFCFENNIKYDININAYNLKEIFNWDEKTHDKFWDEYLDFYSTKINSIIFASEVIEKLIKNDHEIYIITARHLSNLDTIQGEKTRKMVEIWLKKNDIKYDKLIFSKTDEKIKYCEKYKIDLMIEDKVENINTISNLIPVICFDNEYNRSCKGKNIIRCYTWYDIYVKINNMF